LLQRIARALATQLPVAFAPASINVDAPAATEAEPRETEDYSGQFVVRVPRSLHRDLVQAAEREEVSLNQFALAALVRAVGPGAISRDEQRFITRSLTRGATHLHIAAEEEPSYGEKEK
jgi:hypothetical protein